MSQTNLDPLVQQCIERQKYVDQVQQHLEEVQRELREANVELEAAMRLVYQRFGHRSDVWNAIEASRDKGYKPWVRGELQSSGARASN